MIRTKHKIISVVLCVAIVLCALLAVTVTAGAASGDTIYVKVNNGWSTSSIYCYMWKGSGGSGNENQSWPGVQMTKVSGTDNVFTYKLTDNYEKIIFNTGTGGSQTTDLTYTGNGGDGKIYDLKSGTWSQYTEPVTTPTDPTTPTTPSDGITVYLKNTKKWSSPYCYMWKSSGGNGNQNSSWAGEPMTFVEDDVWVYTSSVKYTSCIFSDTKSGNDQTSDLTAQDGQIYDPSTNKWEPYDPGSLHVKSFGATPSDNVFVGMDVELSMEATSKDGAVSYKFSANGTTIRDWAASGSATWTPSAVGSYTISFDAKDSAGNEVNRSVTVQVQSDTDATVPIIKKVTPADNSYVKTGVNATVQVTAGGGKTGTNLLFYKYIINDPTGAQVNTAYYTLNESYTFKPTKEGDYKVTVFVQASDNSEAKKTITVKATGQEITTEPTTAPTEPTQPTTPGYKLGDVNKDGIIDIKDATYMELAFIEMPGYEVTLELGDFNKDGKLNVKDVTAIQRYVAGIVA